MTLLALLLAAALCDISVVHVRDGDTLDIATTTYLSKSDRLNERTGVRMLRVRTPERKEKRWAEAKADLVSLIGGEKVALDFPQKRKRDKYGRLLAEVYRCGPEGKVNLNDLMRSRGWTDSGK